MAENSATEIICYGFLAYRDFKKVLTNSPLSWTFWTSLIMIFIRALTIRERMYQLCGFREIPTAEEEFYFRGGYRFLAVILNMSSQELGSGILAICDFHVIFIWEYWQRIERGLEEDLRIYIERMWEMGHLEELVLWMLFTVGDYFELMLCSETETLMCLLQPLCRLRKKGRGMLRGKDRVED